MTSSPDPRSERLEPPGAEPLAHGLRASDADRTQVSTLLSAAYAEGRLTRQELDERLEQVLCARTFDDLVPLTVDLVPTGPAPSTAPPAQPRYTVEPEAARGTTGKMIAVCGGVDRRGRWRMCRRTFALALFGGISLDLREAVLEGPVIEITGFWCFGGLDITLPAGMEVHDETSGIFGGTEVKDLGERVPGAPTLVIKGATLFGGVSVHGPKPPRKRR